MNIKPMIPAPHQIVREALIVLGGVLIASYVLSRFPKVQAFVQSNSITVKDNSGIVLY